MLSGKPSLALVKGGHLAILPAAAKECCASLGWTRLGFRLRGAAGEASHSQAQG